MSVTMKDIARAAGVSRGTVDRALHGRGAVRPEVSDRIKVLAQSMGYEPNRAGKLLAARKQPILIGCLLPRIGNPFFADVIQGLRQAEAELSDFGMKVLIKEVKGYDSLVHLQAIQELQEAGCNALCLTTVDVPSIRERADQIIRSGTPILTVNTDLTNTKRLCYVGCDYVRGGNAAAGLLGKYLPDAPFHTLIATGSLRMKGHNQRIEGFSHTLQKCGVDYRISDIFECLDDDEQAYQKTLASLLQHPQTDCIYITAGGVAGVCQAVRECKLKEGPKHFWVISFDDIASTRQLIHEGTIDFTITQEPVQQGYQAILRAFNYLLSDKSSPPKTYWTNNIIKIKENL